MLFLLRHCNVCDRCLAECCTGWGSISFRFVVFDVVVGVVVVGVVGVVVVAVVVVAGVVVVGALGTSLEALWASLDRLLVDLGGLYGHIGLPGQVYMAI